MPKSDLPPAVAHIPNPLVKLRKQMGQQEIIARCREVLRNAGFPVKRITTFVEQASEADSYEELIETCQRFCEVKEV